MSFIQKISEFFQSLFSPNSPEALQRATVKRIEAELKNLAPSLIKGGLIQPEFAVALKMLYENTTPIFSILSQSFCSPNLDVSRHYEEQLLLTGFDEETMEILESLSYENRKIGAMEAEIPMKYFDTEHRKLEKVLRILYSPHFEKIEGTLNKVVQLNDICKFSYVTMLKLFDNNFSGAKEYEPDFQAIPADLLESSLLDFYYVITEVDMTVSLYKAVLALYKLQNGGTIQERDALSLKENFKKIQSLCKHYFTKSILMQMIRLSKKDAELIPEKALYNTNFRKKYADFIETKFRVDESRLKTEIQDATIGKEIAKIFEGYTLDPVVGYSKELDSQLKQSTSVSFLWILPMQILKNFIKFYFEPHIKQLFNDIVIEGFFNNPTYKSEFSAIIFSCNESMDRIAAFERKFQRGQPFDEANITSLIKDSHKDSGFENTLKDLIEKINKEAKDIIHAETSCVFQLYKKINDVILESKKPSSEVITNLKVLLISSRNKGNSEVMENQNGQWKTFLEIMKNYVIIGKLEKK